MSARTPASSRPSQASSFLTDLVSTSAAQVLSVGLNAISLAVISRRFGSVDLGLYTLERRGMALLQPLVLVGLSVATPRFIALSLSGASERAKVYAVSGTRLVIAISLALATLILLMPGVFGSIFFGSDEARGLARALAGFMLATAAYQITYSVARGYLHMGRANLAELAVVGAFPLILACVGPTDIVDFMWILNLGVFGVALALVASERDLRRGLLSVPERMLRGVRRELLIYGTARTPGDIAVVALFAIAPIAVVHAADATEAGYTSIVVSALSFVSVAAVPLGIILLPRVAVDLAKEQGISYEKYVRLGEATVDVSIALSALLFVAAPLVAAFWIPDPSSAVITGMELAALGIPGYVFYLIFRSYLDAVDRRPLSSAATISGLAVLVVLLSGLLVLDVFSPTVAAAASLLVALNVGGVVTFVLVHRRIPDFVPALFVLPPAVVLALAVVGGLAVRDESAALVAAASALTATALVAAILISRRTWVAELHSRLKGRLRAQPDD